MDDLQVVSPPIVNDVNATEASTVDQTALNNDVNVATPAASTEVKTDVKPQTVFEAVKASLAESESEKASATSSAKEVVTTEAKANENDDGTSKADANSDEELLKSLDTLDPKSRASGRIRELITENKTLSHQAQNFEALSSWTREAGLDQTEFTTGLQIMQEMKRDPFKALEMLQPYIDSLHQFTGVVLPEDIQAKLDTGLIDEETAQELVANRNKTTMYQERETQNAETQYADQQAQQHAEHVNAIAKGVSAWEKNWELTDPDYSRKKALVKATVTQLLSEEGLPSTPQLAVEQAKRARQMVEKNLLGIMPTRQAVQTVTGRSSITATQSPKNSIEAAKAALAGTEVNY